MITLLTKANYIITDVKHLISEHLILSTSRILIAPLGQVPPEKLLIRGI